eukprot:SAG31_NODE_589_length_13808_cov_3.896710_4_plen_190_part_00
MAIARERCQHHTHLHRERSGSCWTAVRWFRLIDRCSRTRHSCCSPKTGMAACTGYTRHLYRDRVCGGSDRNIRLFRICDLEVLSKMQANLTALIRRRCCTERSPRQRIWSRAQAEQQRGCALSSALDSGCYKGGASDGKWCRSARTCTCGAICGTAPCSVARVPAQLQEICTAAGYCEAGHLLYIVMFA